MVKLKVSVGKFKNRKKLNTVNGFFILFAKATSTNF